MKIALGTAQFGSDYGISNSGGRLAPSEVGDILALAKKHAIGFLDTSPNYGDSESILGQVLDGDWSVITKTVPWTKTSEVITRFKRSLADLKLASVDAILVHSIDDVYQRGFDQLYAKLAGFKREGLVRKVGFSTYTPDQVDFLLANFDFDIIQVPVNVFDQRLISAGHLEKLKSRGIEVHARSVFLQGLLLGDVPTSSHFVKYGKHFEDYFRALSSLNISKLESALNFVLEIEEIDKVVLGVTSLQELEEILSVSKNKTIPYNLFSIDDEQLINPTLWRV